MQYTGINFIEWRKWFNRTFSLSVNGKFRGVAALKNFELFAYKLYKMLSRPSRYGRARNDVLLLHVSGQTIKLYSR